MMDCGPLPLFVCWCFVRVCCGRRGLRVVALGELGQVCPFGKWGAMTLMVIAPGYLMACSTSPFSAGIPHRRDVPDPQQGVQIQQEVSIGGAVPLCFTRLEVTVRMPS